MNKMERLDRQRQRLTTLLAPEEALRKEGYRLLAGMDEVGRGPLAGPVYAACVVLPEDMHVLGVDDSKRISEKRRATLEASIRQLALACGIGTASPREIDRYNILEATKLAMRRALDEARRQLPEGQEIDLLLIDAVHLDDLDTPQRSVIGGDASHYSIAAASIVAKVARDNFMREMAEQYPGYAFEKNKGYGTAAHYAGLRTLGMCPLHRRSFLRKFLAAESAGREAAGE